jgi:hypothetical protein
MILLLYSLNFNKFKSVARYLALFHRPFAPFLFFRFIGLANNLVVLFVKRTFNYLEICRKRVLFLFSMVKNARFSLVETRSCGALLLGDYEPMKTLFCSP